MLPPCGKGDMEGMSCLDNVPSTVMKMISVMVPAI